MSVGSRAMSESRLLGVVTVFLGVEWVLLLVTQPAVALAAAAVWLVVLLMQR